MALVSYMRLDTDKTDVFGRYNFLTQDNYPTYPANTGINGSALFSVAGTTDLRAGSADMNDYENMSISFRMNPQFDYADTDITSVIFYTSLNGHGGYNNVNIVFGHNATAGNFLRFQRRDSDKSKFRTYAETTDANNPGTKDYQWNTIIGSWNGWDTYAEILVNGGIPGTADDTSTGTVTAFDTSASQLLIGNAAAAVQYMEGYLDEFKIYNHALSVGEKQDIYTDYEGGFVCLQKI